MRASKFTAVALLVAGCGGGGSDTAVSPSPPAGEPPVAAAPGPAPAPPPRVDAPSPIQAPAPKPEAPAPAPVPPPGEAPVPPPTSAPPAPPAPPAGQPTITRAVLETGLSVSFAHDGPYSVGSLAGDPMSTAYIRQWTAASHPEDPRMIYMSYQSGGLANNDLDVSALYYEMPGGDIPAVIQSSSGGYSTHLGRSSSFRLTEPAYALNQTLAQWDSPPYFAQLQIQSDPRSDTIFRLCWHLRIPEVIRLSCGLFDRLTGDHRGVHIVDDSQGLGPRTWQTR